MSYECIVYKILIASPSDVSQEREELKNLIFNWNMINSTHYKIMFSPVMWEANVTPELGGRPQEIINEQIVNDCDILIGVFWTRLGTPTGVEESGTIEEINQFISSDKKTMIYFSNTPIVPSSIDSLQYEKLTNFKNYLYEQGVVDNFSSISEFKSKINNHLTLVAQNLSNTFENNIQTKFENNFDNNHYILKELKKNFNSFKIDWITEKDSGTYTIDDGKYILEQIQSELTYFLGKINIELPNKEELIKVITELKRIQNHQVYLGGSKSFNAFWVNGDKIISILTNQINQINL
ncbi:DUF4062 domain-containing protein [Haliovirga abyssi]|uniref:DUF4062 domain-containing protein n=1 Tax=Haliovirga abyssi TaxID=2996794 RepID=A0AAU9DEX8_9FUSO|nr:DUF4062 domain-containing protein [Haliovirga abyssi]BDU50942.1 hypothetical protein HLVA_15110 [Haliovirga abyssi]